MLYHSGMTFESWFHHQYPSISTQSCKAVLTLVAEGSTVPFIARYRKEQTLNLDEVAIQKTIDAKEEWDQIIKRQLFITGEIEHQKILTPELKEKIMSTFELEKLEDLYLPFKQKRKTKATQAKEAGLEPLANWIWDCGHGLIQPEPGQTLDIWASTFLNPEKDIKTSANAIEGAQDILIERLSEILELRQRVRDTLYKNGFICSSKADGAKVNSKFENYFSYSEKIDKLLLPQNSHRYLAIRRGWEEKELVVSLGGSPGDETLMGGLVQAFENAACAQKSSLLAPLLQKTAKMALNSYVYPAIENEVHKALKNIADDAAITVFAENLRKLLLAPPLGPKAVLGIDPGIRTGCKLAVVDASGKFLGSTVIHLQSEKDKNNAKILLDACIKNGSIHAIAVGNGTAGRETEIFLRSALKELTPNIPIVMVNEAGASVYSASEVAREEFPDLDLTIRGAISIARRLQDPLAELVKVDPKSIGVGQYQHDVSPHSLKKSLEFIVDSCVNSVGVALNTASNYLLARVAGIGPALAKSIVEYRNKKGLFKSRAELLNVPRFSQKVFEQAAGFLRIPDSIHPLDNTAIHPENYPILEEIAIQLKKNVQDLLGSGVTLLKQNSKLRDKLGHFTFDDIIKELAKPGRDPRECFVAFAFREDIHEVKDLKPVMICPGIVTNVTNFGAFVDIGVHQDGLVHISQLADKFVKDPRQVVSPGDPVKVKVLDINIEKKQVALTMKLQDTAPRVTTERSVERPVQRPSIKPTAAPAPAFNNPFAALGALRKSTK